MRAKLFFILCALIFLGALCINVFSQRPPHTPPNSTEARSVPKQETDGYWAGRIEAVGGSRAYKELSSYLADKEAFTQHDVAHFFGRALYTTEGVEGVAVCDEHFTSGCLHEFIARAIISEGLSNVDLLDAACSRSTSPMAFTMCQHGVGHGVLAYLGFSEKNLAEALAVCKALPNVGVLEGCYSGVFMEYNVRGMVSLNTPRPMTEGAMYLPCLNLPEEYQSACIYRQPQWWLATIFAGRTNDVVVYKDMGQLCKTGNLSKKLVRNCIEGVAIMLRIDTTASRNQIPALCNTVSNVPSEQLLCKSFSAAVISVAWGTQTALLACADLSGAAYAYCKDYANGEVAFVEKPIPAELDK